MCVILVLAFFVALFKFTNCRRDHRDQLVDQSRCSCLDLFHGLRLNPVLPFLSVSGDFEAVIFDEEIRVSVVNRSGFCVKLDRGTNVFEGKCVHNERQVRLMVEKSDA